MDGKIVIMDYSPYERQKIRHIVEKTGTFELIEVESHTRFKEIGSIPGDVSLFIMDINFPSEKEGFEFLSGLRSSETTQKVPVIIVTRSDTPELKAAVLKLGVKDYIARPYSTSRLENSIRSILKPEKLFHYDTSGIGGISMSFDEYISREISYSRRTGNPLSFIILTMLKLDAEAEGQAHREIAGKDRVFPIAAELARASLRSTDTIFVNKDRDIIIVLPCTGEEGADAVCGKLKEQMLEELRAMETEQSEYIYPVHVTYPGDGESFQALMECALGKVSMKEMLEKMASIPTDTRKYANRRYNQFRRWF